MDTIKILLTCTILLSVMNLRADNATGKEVFHTSRSLLMQGSQSGKPRNASSDEKRLTKHLLRNYQRIGKEGRPVSNASEAVYVKFGLAMMQMHLDERENRLTVSVWCRYRWEDEFLTWDPDDYSGIKSVRLTSSKIWIPDIMLYNTADTHKLERDVLVVVSNTGSVLWIPHRIYHASCSVDVTNFPFDSQVCHMTFGSWAYHGNEIDLKFYEDLEQMDISDLEKENTEWVITAKTENRRIQYYDCCDEPYVTLTFTLALKRKLVFSSFILTLPCIFLACMTLVVFWLPPERPDRTSLAMSLFASFLLLLLILVEAAPPTASSVPLLGVYYCFNMVIIMLSIFLSCVVINISRRGDAMRPVPNWLRVIAIDGLSRVFCTRNRHMNPPASPSTTAATNRLLRRNSSRRKGNGDRSSTIITNEGIVAIPRHEREHDSSPTAALAAAIGLHSPQATYTAMHSTINGGINIGNHGGGGGGGIDAPNSSCPATVIATSQLSGMDKKTLDIILKHLATTQRTLKTLEDNSRMILEALKEKDMTKALRQLRLEWQMVAMTLDRIFFLIFALAIVLSLITLFPRPYQMTFGD